MLHFGPMNPASKLERQLQDVARLLESAAAIDLANSPEWRALSAADRIAYCDKEIAKLQAIQHECAALKLRVAIRAGEGLLAAGERRGGDHRSDVKEPLHFDNATKMQRRDLRMLGKHRRVVEAYIQSAKDATMRGALKAARDASR